MKTTSDFIWEYDTQTHAFVFTPEILDYLGVENKEAISSAKELCREVAEISILWRESVIHFTVSIGISHFSKKDSDYNGALNRADYGMYRVKKKSKNNVQWI